MGRKKNKNKINARQEVRRLRRDLHGHAVRTSFDPPMFCDKPWNSATIEFGFTGDKSISVSQMHGTVLSQLGLVSTQSLEYRFLKCRVWALTPQRPLRVSFFGISSGPVALALLQDWGAPQRLPHVGYQYPTAFQLCTYKSSNTDEIVSVDVGKDSSGSDIPWLMYMDLLWRSDVYNPITSSVRYRLMNQNVASTSTSSDDWCSPQL